MQELKPRQPEKIGNNDTKGSESMCFRSLYIGTGMPVWADRSFFTLTDKQDSMVTWRRKNASIVPERVDLCHMPLPWDLNYIPFLPVLE
jgi:hypothetical protein